MRFRIERTELHTRVWIIEAESERDALDKYMDEEEVDAYGYHHGQPHIEVTGRETQK